MTWAYIISSADRQLFKRCRRAWDLGSQLRQNYEPLKPATVFDILGKNHKRQPPLATSVFHVCTVSS